MYGVQVVRITTPNGLQLVAVGDLITKKYKMEENTIERTMLTTPLNPPLPQGDVSGSLRFSERDVDFAYLCGVFNVSGIDGLHKEIQRLKAIGKDPHDIIEACRKQ